MNVNLEVSINEANAILGLLGKCPYDQVAILIDKIRAQITEQTRAPDTPS